MKGSSSESQFSVIFQRIVRRFLVILIFTSSMWDAALGISQCLGGGLFSAGKRGEECRMITAACLSVCGQLLSFRRSPLGSGLLRSCWLWSWASYFSASFQITWRVIGFLILQGVWRNGPKARMSRWVLQSLFPPPQVLQNLPAVMGTGLSCPAGTAPEVPHYSAVSNGCSIKFSENYFGSLSGWNCVHKITTLLLLIVYENNCVGVWSTGCALCKAVVTRVCSLGSVLFLLGTPSVSLCLHRIVKQQEPLALKITCLFASVLRQFLVIFHHLTWRRSPL